MALIPPFLLDCVVAIGFRSDPDKVSYQATGFLYGKPINKSPEGEQLYRIYLVTNRHVFEGAKAAVLRFNPTGSEPARSYDLDLIAADGTRRWLTHPVDSVDVAAIPINARVLREHNIQFAFFLEPDHLLLRDRAKDLGVSEGDGVFVLGFPLGQVGGERNYVIVRSGVIARVRDALAGAANDFLVDASIFPGNSGGPVITRPEITSIEGTKSLNSALLLGIVSGYVPYQDIAVSQQTKRPRIVFEENSGLASVVPVDRVVETIAAAHRELAPEPAAPSPATPE